METSGYRFTIADRRLMRDGGFSPISPVTRPGQSNPYAGMPSYSSTAMSHTVMGGAISLAAINSTSLFGTNDKLLTTLTIEGMDSGARTTIPVEVSRVVVASTSPQGQVGLIMG